MQTNVTAPRPARPAWSARALPVTVALVCGVWVAGLATRSAFGAQLAAAAVERFGFAPRDALTADVARAILSAFVTADGRAFAVALVAVAGLSAYVEWRWGSAAASLAFWGTHALTLLLATAALVPLGSVHVELARVLFLARDVGPSAGYAGCAGWILARTAPRVRVPLLALALAALGAALAATLPGWRAHPLEVSAAATHLIALPTGAALALLFASLAGSRPPGGDVQPVR